MNTEIKTITIALVLLTGIFLNILPSVPGTNGTEGTQGQPGPGSMVILPSIDAQSDNSKDNPYSFQWWYKYKQFQNFDSDNDDNKDDKKSKKHSKQSSSSNERLDKKLCANSGIWNGKKCIIKDPEEQAAYEDAVCDNPSDTKKYAKLCGGSSVKEDKKKDSTTITVQPTIQQQYQKETPEQIKQIEQKLFENFHNAKKVYDEQEAEKKAVKEAQQRYAESKFSQDIADDDPTTAEYKEKVLKFASEESPEQKEASEEHSFYDDAYDKSNDYNRNTNNNDNDDDNKKQEESSSNNDSSDNDDDSGDDDSGSDDSDKDN